jgi:putative heme iron utilization protein
MPVVVLATVVVPQAYVAAYKIAVQAQLAVQLASYPIGGSSVQAPPFTVPLDDIIGALDEAGVIVLGQASYVKAIQSLSIASGATTVTAAGAGLPFPGPSYQAVLSPASVITVLGS